MCDKRFKNIIPAANLSTPTDLTSKTFPNGRIGTSRVNPPLSRGAPPPFFPEDDETLVEVIKSYIICVIMLVVLFAVISIPDPLDTRMITEPDPDIALYADIVNPRY